MKRAATAMACVLLAGCDAMPPARPGTGATRARTESYVAVPPGSVPRGTTGALAQLLPPGPPITRELMARGRERYDVFCSPCHGRAGYGDGVVVQRGFTAPLSFHVDRQQDLTRARVVEVITSGFGLMLSFAERIPPQERWAIASYVKALQLSQSFPIDRLPDDLRSQVER
ncbi:MAG: c-type cytochrome [Hyphomicrobiaceae bacterium]|nr:c-type cytochrome [Hyphomicrobiaceae bacterium]